MAHTYIPSPAPHPYGGMCYLGSIPGMAAARAMGPCLGCHRQKMLTVLINAHLIGFFLSSLAQVWPDS